MGYDIYIGEAVLRTDGEMGDEIWIDVERIEHPDAPYWESSGRWPDASGKTNGRHPGYGQFREFCRTAGLEDLFLDPDYGLLRDHPGVKLILPNHLEKIKMARQNWEKTHPNSKPGWNEGEDPILARLLWYEWWFRWALENCKIPIIRNY